MPVRIRLQRVGVRHSPAYRIVAATARSRRDGKCLERLGSYNPVPDASGVKSIQWNSERIRYWIGVGAQPTDTVARLLSKAGILPTLPRVYSGMKVAATKNGQEDLKVPAPPTHSS